MATRIVKHVDIVDTLVKYIFSLARGKWPDPPHTLSSSLQLTKILFIGFCVFVKAFSCEMLPLRLLIGWPSKSEEFIFCVLECVTGVRRHRQCIISFRALAMQPIADSWLSPYAGGYLEVLNNIQNLHPIFSFIGRQYEFDNGRQMNTLSLDPLHPRFGSLLRTKSYSILAMTFFLYDGKPIISKCTPKCPNMKLKPSAEPNLTSTSKTASTKII